MPELPEVETVRRGLEPAMDGARFAKIDVNRGDLRWPLPKDFTQRLQGQKVEGLGRRAKYLLADLSSGDVLIMHLGMSGSFRLRRNGETFLGDPRYFETAKDAKHDHVVFHMSSGATVTFNDPRRFGSMKLVPRATLDEEPLLRALHSRRTEGYQDSKRPHQYRDKQTDNHISGRQDRGEESYRSPLPGAPGL